MVDFRPWPECLREYTDPSDRRFHAQNIACPRCGPRIRLEMSSDSGAMPHSGYPSANSTDLPVLEQASCLLRDGKILAVKGVAAFIFFATQPRRRPFANCASANAVIASRWPFSSWMWAGLGHAEVDEAARAALLGADSPIVLLRPGSVTLAGDVAPGLARRKPPTRRSIGPSCGW